MKIQEVYSIEDAEKVPIEAAVRIFYKHSPRSAWMVEAHIEQRTEEGFISFREEREGVATRYQTMMSCLRFFDKEQKNKELRGTIELDFRNCSEEQYPLYFKKIKINRFEK